MKVICMVCRKSADRAEADGWLIRKKTFGGGLLVVCPACLKPEKRSLTSATMDVMDSEPFRSAERDHRRELEKVKR